MKVKELKEWLEIFDEDMDVTIEGASPLCGFSIQNVIIEEEKVWDIESKMGIPVKRVHLVSHGIKDLHERALGVNL